MNDTKLKELAVISRILTYRTGTLLSDCKDENNVLFAERETQLRLLKVDLRRLKSWLKDQIL